MTLALLVPPLLLIALILYALRRRRGWRRHRTPARQDGALSTGLLIQPKPSWVAREVVRLKALMPEDGCRKISFVFNHLHGRRRGVTVGKSYVANVIRTHQYDILRTREKLKRRRPRRLPRNLVWALDLTFVPATQTPHAVLGLIDHGSRACLALCEMRNHTTIAILRVILDVIERHGKPLNLRTDNDAVFVSRWFAVALLLLGIRHQRSAPFAPWQNGRIERFFLTFKQRIVPWHTERGNTGDLTEDLRRFRLWYNHARPHEHLAGLTPAMAWASQAKPQGRARYVSDWNGRLSGFLFPT